MPLRFSHGLFSRHTYFCSNYIQDCLWTSVSNLICNRPSEIIRTWRCTNLHFVKTRSSYDLDSGSRPKDISLYLLYPIELEDRIKREVILLSNSTFERGISSFSVSRSIDLKVLSKVAFIKKSICSYGTLLSHLFLSSKFSEPAMCGWNISMAKNKDTQKWSQFWSDGRRTHMGHAHGHDNGDHHDPHEKLGGYRAKVLRWDLW